MTILRDIVGRLHNSKNFETDQQLNYNVMSMGCRVSKYTCVIASLFRHPRIEELRREHSEVTGHRRVICPSLAFAVASRAGRPIYQSSLK